MKVGESNSEKVRVPFGPPKFDPCRGNPVTPADMAFAKDVLTVFLVTR